MAQDIGHQLCVRAGGRCLSESVFVVLAFLPARSVDFEAWRASAAVRDSK
jgi:hypothetical protein